MSGIAGLLARVEAARGPDREIDIWIDAASGAGRKIIPTVTADQVAMLVDSEDGSIREGMSDADAFGVPAYTASVDAALALVERMLPGSSYDLSLVAGNKPVCDAKIWPPALPLGVGGEGHTLPLAILAALLRALAPSSSESET